MYSCLFPIEGLCIIERIRRSIVPDDTQLSNAVTDGSIDLGTMDALNVRGLLRLMLIRPRVDTRTHSA